MRRLSADGVRWQSHLKCDNRTPGLDAEGRGSCNSPSGGTQTSCVNNHDGRRAAATSREFG